MTKIPTVAMVRREELLITQPGKTEIVINVGDMVYAARLASAINNLAFEDEEAQGQS